MLIYEANIKQDALYKSCKDYREYILRETITDIEFIDTITAIAADCSVVPFKVLQWMDEEIEDDREYYNYRRGTSHAVWYAIE